MRNIYFQENGFKEILLNSINHKQYEESNPIQISVYDDKLYVWNDGKFPEEIAKQDVFKKHFSKPYNPLIAQTFFKAGYIESWGRGFEKIKSECEKYSVPIPEVQINANDVMIKCNPSQVYLDLLGDIKNKNVHKNAYGDISNIQKQILDILEKEPETTQYEIAMKINTTSKTVQRNIAKLKELKIIERVGTSRKGYWKIL